MTIIQQPSEYEFAGNLPDIILESAMPVDVDILHAVGEVTLTILGGSSTRPVDSLIEGTPSGATGYVKSWDNGTGTLELYGVVGTFTDSDSLTGPSGGGDVNGVVDSSTVLLLSETYVPDSNGSITIELREFFERILKTIVPPTSESAYVQSDGYMKVIMDIDETEISFTVIAGGGINLGSIIGDRWHTWQLSDKYIKLNDQEWLTFFPYELASVYVRLIFPDSEELIKVADIAADRLTTVNVSPSAFTQDETLMSLTAWVAEVDTPETVLSNIQTFIISTEYFEHDELFVFTNSLGGVDSIRFTGQLTQIEEFQIDSALFGRALLEYHSESIRAFTKNTGSFRSRHELLWARDFFASTEKHRYQYQQYYKVLTSGQLPSVKHNLNSYEFEFVESEPVVYQNEYDLFGLPVPPNAPNNLSANIESDTENLLTWTDNSSNETGFEVWKAETEDGEYVLIGEPSEGVEEFLDDDIL